MKVLLTGGTGFVGSILSRELAFQGHEITILTRKRSPGPAATGIRYLTGDPTKGGPWQAQVADHDWVINLAGASIFTRWTAEAKKTIYESRIATTRNLVAALAAGDRRQLFCSTSAPGYFGDRGEEELTEDSPPGRDFLARVAQDWETEALKAQDLGIRTVITRFGLVLGREGGLLQQLVPLFRKFLGGPLGSGRQWFSWIHYLDLARAFRFLPEHPELTGPVHFCAPNPVRNRDLARALGRVLHRPAFMPVPAFMLRLILGEFADVPLTSQRMLPAKLLAAGFQFRFPNLNGALEDLLASK